MDSYEMNDSGLVYRLERKIEELERRVGELERAARPGGLHPDDRIMHPLARYGYFQRT